ncbi:MAG: hypothetical protein ACREBU_09915 [Nitrososphaera sp.]
MPTIQKNADRREEWLAEARSMGKRVQPYNEIRDEKWQTRFFIDGKDCNVQVREVENNRMWIHVGNNFVKELDNFVFIPRTRSHFYNIPKSEMCRLAGISTPNSTDGRAEFNINVETDELFIRGTPHGISRYRNNWDFG